MECSKTSLTFGVVCRAIQEHANTAHLFGLLRTRRERPADGNTANERDEVSPPHGLSPWAGNSLSLGDNVRHSKFSRDR